MNATPEQLKELGITPEEAQLLIRLNKRLDDDQKTKSLNGQVARKDFGEWLKEVLPAVGKALGYAATTIAKLLNAISIFIKAV